MNHFNILTTVAFVICFLFSNFGNAQVGIGTTTPHPSAALDITSNNKGFLGPHIALTSRTDNTTISNPVDGLIVFNTTTLAGNVTTELKPSYYTWYNGRWQSYKFGEELLITRDGRRRNLLGYDPNGTPNTINFTVPSINGRPAINYTGINCIKFDIGAGATNHTYCTFQLNNNTPQWQEAFEAAKSKGGYLVTITTPEEWKFILENILKDPNHPVNGSVWIGYNKVNFSGNPTEFSWITGETSQITWNNASTTFQNYRPGEPNNQNNNEGCVHILNTANGGGVNNRQWNDLTCDNASYSGPFDHIIIEFDR